MTTANHQDDVEELKAADAQDVHQAVREAGEAELSRPAASLWSALAAGLAINASLVAEGVLHALLPDGPARLSLVSLGYPVGFVIVILGRMQFFTESTVTAMPLVARPSAAALRRTLRLWGLVLGADLAGTALVALAMTHTAMVDPAVRDGMVAVSRRLLTHDAWSTFLTAIPAGFLIAGLAWVLPNGREQAFLVIFAVAWTVGAAGFSHSVVGSAEAFVLMWRGVVTPGAAAALIVPAVVGNLVGGAGLFAMLAHGQVHGETRQKGVTMGKKKKALREAAAREHVALTPLRALAGTATIKALTPLAKGTDEPPLLALGLGTLALGAMLRRPAMARSGARMVASHLVATGLKTVLKAGVDRARPNATPDGPRLEKGHGTDDTNLNAFPSGHTAGAVAVAQAIGHETPGAATPARLVAGAAGALQVARGAHYASDVAAGAAIGWLSERLAGLAIDTAARVMEHRRTVQAEAEVEAHPS